MKISKSAIYRPVTTTMFFLIVILFGVVSFLRLPIDLMPEVNYPAITISTEYENVGPEEIEQLITRPIEETVSSIQGVEKITSTSIEGRSTVRVAFIWGTDLDDAANDVRARVDRTKERLPEDADTPVIFKFDISSFPVMFLRVSSNLDQIELRDLVERQVKYRMERVDGVAAVDVRGGLTREIHVDLDRRKLTALNLSLDSILEALQGENLNLPAGKVDEGDLEILVRTMGEYTTVEEISQTVVQVRDGVPILIKDLGTVDDSHEEITFISRSEGQPILRLYVNKQSGANTVDVCDGITEEMEKINQDFPQIRVFTTLDSSTYIKQSIANVRDSAMQGAVLAAVILILFLRNLRSTLIISVAIPISVISTFALMYFYHFTLNIMTFGGLALGVGMLVDSAIVVLENIFRQHELGSSGRKAAVRGTEEVATAIVASTLTTIVVFLPVLFVRGISGITFQQLAAVVVFSLLCSLVVALTLIPVLAARFLNKQGINNQAENESPHGPIMTFFEQEYGYLIEGAFRIKKTVLLVTFMIFVGSIWMTKFVGVEFMPKADEGEVRISGEMAVGTRLEVVDETFQAIERIVREAVPEAQTLYSQVGSMGWRSAGGIQARSVSPWCQWRNESARPRKYAKPFALSWPMCLGR